MINLYFVLLAFMCIIIPIMAMVGVFDASSMYNQVAFGHEDAHIQYVQGYCTTCY